MIDDVFDDHEGLLQRNGVHVVVGVVLAVAVNEDTAPVS
jgi:hypothetical protein